MKRTCTTLIAGSSLLIPWVILASLPDVSIGSVYPVWVWVFLILLELAEELVPLRGASGILLIMLPALCFFVWNPRLFRGSVKVPRRTYVLFAVGALLSLSYFALAWNDGLTVQGVQYTYTVFAANIVIVAALGFMFAISRKAEPSFRTDLSLHWTLFVWLFWFAFPYLGPLGFP